MEPSLKVSDGEFKPLSQCSREETGRLLDQLLEKYEKAMHLPNPSLRNQLVNMMALVEERIKLFDSGYFRDEGFSRKKIRKKITLLDDDD